MRQLQEFQEDRMVRKSVKITVCTMAAVMAFSGMNITANAAASSSVLPSGGIELTLAKGNKLESLSTGTNSTKQIESIIETVIRDDQMDTTPKHPRRSPSRIW